MSTVADNGRESIMAIDIALEPLLDVEESPPPDPDALYEIVDGVHVEMSPMSYYSNLIAWRLARRMDEVVEEAPLGAVCMENMFLLDLEQRWGRRPDVAFVSVERWPLDREIPEEGEWQVVPDLCVEVNSPNDRVEDLYEKIDDYFDASVRQVWVVSPGRRRIYVYDSPTQIRTVSATEVIDAGDIIPGFQMAVSEMFDRTLRPRAPE